MDKCTAAVLRSFRMRQLEKDLHRYCRLRDERLEQDAVRGRPAGATLDPITITWNMKILSIREELMDLRYPR